MSHHQLSAKLAIAQLRLEVDEQSLKLLSMSQGSRRAPAIMIPMNKAVKVTMKSVAVRIVDVRPNT